MKFAPVTTAAIATVAALGLAAPAFAQNQPSQRQPGAQSPGESQRQDQKDMAKVEIERSSTWGFSNEVRKYLSDGYEDMYSDPEEAIEDFKLAENMTRILAAACEAEEGKQALTEAADGLSRFVQKLENRQIASPDELSGPGSAVVLAIAKAQFGEAEKGLEEGDEAAVAYSLDSAADNLFQAHVYLKKAPSDASAEAIFNAHRLGTQLKSLIEPTTQQGAQFTVTIPEEESDFEDSGILDDAGQANEGEAQVAGSRQGGQQTVADQIPQVAPQVIEALGKALDEAQQAADEKQASQNEDE